MPQWWPGNYANVPSTLKKEQTEYSWAKTSADCFLLTAKANEFHINDVVTEKFVRLSNKIELCRKLIGIHSINGWTAFTKHGVTRKRRIKKKD